MAKSRIVKRGFSVKKGLKDKFKADQILNSYKDGEAELEKKKDELIKAKETYYRLCGEFIKLWSKTKKAQRGA